MSQYFTTVNVLHCGDDEEISFIELVENALLSLSPQPFVLEYTRFQDNQTKDAFMIRDAQKYKKEKVPLIVLISKKFFDVVWVTSNKQGILNVITSYSTRNCLHVWVNVGDDDVQRRSKALMRRDKYFRRMKKQELQNLGPEDMVKRILTLLGTTGDGKFNPLNNYPVDNEVEEMRRNFLASIGYVPTDPQQPYKPKKKSIASMISMEDNETDANESSSSNTQPSKKKKKKKKSGIGVYKFADISESDLGQIAISLSKGPGANWKQLAEAFAIDKHVIKKIIDDNLLDLSRSKNLLDLLKSSKGELDISEFVLKCKHIMRNDVATYIKDNVMS